MAAELNGHLGSSNLLVFLLLQDANDGPYKSLEA